MGQLIGTHTLEAPLPKIESRRDWLERYRPTRFAEFYYSLDDEPLAIAIAMLRSMSFQNLCLHGGYGFGKTSLARVIGSRMQCRNFAAHPYEPCGKCRGCHQAHLGRSGDCFERYFEISPRYGDLWEQVQDTLKNVRGTTCSVHLQPGLPRVICIDEFNTLALDQQARFLKVFEDEQEFLFIVCTSHEGKLTGGVESRLEKVEFYKPTFEQYEPWITRILDQEGRRAEDGALKELFRQANGEPRNVLKLAQRWANSSPDTQFRPKVARHAAHDQMGGLGIQTAY